MNTLQPGVNDYPIASNPYSNGGVDTLFGDAGVRGARMARASRVH